MKRLFFAVLILITFTTMIRAQEQTAPVPADRAATMESGSLDGAMRLYRQRRYESAIAEFEKIVAADPKNAAAYYFMGYAHYVMKHHQDALAAFAKAFEADPNFDPRPYYRR